jgi:TP901 family phage tail tape measure protein
MQDQKLRVDIIGDASKLNRALNTASGKLQSFGKKVTSVGQNLSMKLTLPLAIAGGAAIKMASDFDKSMTQIKTLVGIASDEVNQMGKVAIQMAKDTGVSAKDAADALFFITSAGLRGTDAMAVLEQSLKASAIGLGETKVVADLATSALNAYGIENLSAAQATDVLTASIREGKLEADSLSQSMGTVLPIASQLGVKFSEVGATFAAMSRTGTDAAMAATQIRGVLFALLKPTKQANDTLEQFGLSATGLRDKIKKDGLLATLKLLTETFGDNEEAQGKVFANTRALSGVLDLMGNNLASTEQIFSRMNNTAGITAEAFTELEKSASFKLEKSLNDLSVAFTEIGGVLLQTFLPLIQDISSLLVSLSNKFQSLNPTVKKIIVVFTALVAAAGPLLILLGAMSSGAGLVASGFATALPILIKVAAAFKSLTIAMLSNPVGIIAAGVVTLIAGFVEYLHRLEPAVSRTKTFFNLLKSLGNPLKFAALQAEDAAKALAQKTKDATAATKANAELKKSLEGLNQPLKVATTETKNLSNALEKVERVSEISLSVTKGDFDFQTGEFAQGDIAVGAQQIQTPGIDGVEAPDGDATGAALEGLLAMQNQANQTATALDNLAAKNERMKELGDMIGGEVANAFYTFGEAAIGALGLAENGFGRFLGGMASTVLQLISMFLAQSIAQAIAGATASGAATGPGAVFTTPAFIATAVGGVLGAFAAIPKFANGGIVSGPTMGLMGEYPGAKSNPEVIAPLDKLQGMMGGGASQNVNVGGEFKINGQDLVVALQRADRNRSRIK